MAIKDGDFVRVNFTGKIKENISQNTTMDIIAENGY